MDGVLPVTWDKKAQLSVVCQSLCLDLKCIGTLWNASEVTLVMPCNSACALFQDNLKSCTHLSVIKCEWEALSNNSLHETYWPDLFWNSTMSVACRICTLGLHLNEEPVLTSTVELPLESSVSLISDYLSSIDWICLSMWCKVWCLLWHWRHTCLKSCVIYSKCLQAFQTMSWLLVIIKALFSLHFEKLSHLNLLCDPLQK